MTRNYTHREIGKQAIDIVLNALLDFRAFDETIFEFHVKQSDWRGEWLLKGHCAPEGICEAIGARMMAKPWWTRREAYPLWVINTVVDTLLDAEAFDEGCFRPGYRNQQREFIAATVLEHRFDSPQFLSDLLPPLKALVDVMERPREVPR